jgi:hypothetical protein
MQLFAALGGVLMNTTGAGPDMTAAWTNVLELAERLDDPDYRMRALWGLWVNHRNKGEYREAMAAAQEFRGIAAGTGHADDLAISDRMLGVSLHYLGDQIRAREHIESMLSRDVTPLHRSDILRFQFDQRGSGPLLSWPHPLAAGVSRSGQGYRRKQCRWRSRDPPRNFAGLRVVRGSVPGRGSLSATWRQQNDSWRCCSSVRSGTDWASGMPWADASGACC